MKPSKPQNSARVLKLKAKLKAAQTKPLKTGFLSQDKFPVLSKSSEKTNESNVVFKGDSPDK
jgi:hypothetical protein